MAIVTYPLNNIMYNAEDAALYNCTRKSGVYAGDDFRCTVTGTNNIVTVGLGVGWIHPSRFSGLVFALKTTQAVDLGIPDSQFPRWDVVCARFSAAENAVKIAIKKGKAESRPKVPAITQTASVYELYLCKVYREPGAVTVLPKNVTDTRLDPSVCGLMADSVTRIDTGAINNQISALIFQLEKDITAAKDKSAYLLRDGSAPMTGDFNAGGNKMSNVKDPTEPSDAVTKGSLLDLVYPVGSIYISTNNSSPALFFGGTWEQIKGRFLLGSGNPDANTDNFFGPMSGTKYNAGPNSRGGQDYHKLTVSEMPEHSHGIQLEGTTLAGASILQWQHGKTGRVYEGGDVVRMAGGNEKHNNMPPYFGVHMWKRLS